MKTRLVRSIKVLLYTICSIIGFVLLYYLCYLLLSGIPVNKNHKKDGDITIWIRTNGVHVDVVLPVKNEITDWSKFVKPEYTKGKDSAAKWVAFGWGDKGFYLQTPTWADLKFSVAFCALTGLSEAAMHVTFYKELYENDKCRPYKISAEAYKQLILFVRSGFDISGTGETIPIITNANYGDNDTFYEGRGTYSLFHTCNTWTNNALKYAGLPGCAWTPFENGIMDKYR